MQSETEPQVDCDVFMVTMMRVLIIGASAILIVCDCNSTLLVWFHHNLAGFSNSNNDFCCFLSVITRYYDGPYTLLETG
jgi:hypothetical protein